VGVGLDGGRPQPGLGPGGDVVVGDREAGAHLLQGVDGGDQPVLAAARHPHLAAGHEPGHQVGERLEPVALQAGGGAGQPVDALDDDAAVGLEADAGPHALEEQGQLGDLGFEGGVAEDRAPLGQHGAEQHALGGADAGVGEGDLGAPQLAGLGADAVGRDGDLGPHGLERGDVEVDGALAYAVAAHQGHERLVVAGQKRAEQQDGDAVEAGELERHPGVGGVDRLDGDAVALDGYAHTQRGEDAGGDAHVAHVGGVGDLARPGAQHGGDHVLGHRVLRATDLHFAHQGAVGADVPGLGEGLVHGRRA
jgi:hypothetical protein